VGAGSEMLMHLRLQRGEGIAGWVAEHNAPLIVDDVHRRPALRRALRQDLALPPKSILCVPLTFKGRVLWASSSW